MDVLVEYQVVGKVTPYPNNLDIILIPLLQCSRFGSKHLPETLDKISGENHHRFIKSGIPLKHQTTKMSESQPEGGLIILFLGKLIQLRHRIISVWLI